MATGLGAVFATSALAAPAPPAAGVAPGAYTNGTTRFVVYTGSDKAVYEKRVSGGAATSLGGALVSGPSPILAGSTRIVFGEGTDHALWVKSGNSPTAPWTSLGGRLTSKPGAAVGSTSSTYRVYVRGTDGAVWARNHTGNTWGPWHLVGGQVLSGTGPDAAFRTSNFWVLVAGTDHGLWIARDGVTGFTSAGGRTNSSPGLVSSDSSGSLVGFARGTNNAGFFHRFISTTPGWHSMGGFLTSGTGGSATNGGNPSNRRWSAYGLGGNGQVYEHAGTGNATGGWTQVTP